MINIFLLIATLPIEIPLCVHFEYPLGGAEHGDRKITMDAKEILDFMKKDLAFVQARV